MADDEKLSLDSQAASQPDAEGTLRADLAAQLAQAHQALASQLSALLASPVDPAVADRVRDQLMAIAGLQESVSTSRGSALMDLRVAVRANVNMAESLAVKVAELSFGYGPITFELATNSFALREQMAAIHTDLFEKRIFDSFLSFSSPEDEAAYRQREADARRYIEEQLNRHTPEGDLNASGTTLGHMLDAHEHGAGKSPEFLGEWNRLLEVTERQRRLMREQGLSTDEFDRNISGSVRRFLKHKGVSDDVIETIATSPYPLDAVKPFLDGSDKSGELFHDLERDRNHSLSERTPIAKAATAPGTASAEIQAGASPELADVMAVFRAAGVKSGADATPHVDGSVAIPGQRQGSGPNRLA